MLPLLGFTPNSGAVVADLDRAMEFGVFVEGTSRSGKTNLVRVFLEQTYGLIQHIVLDPEGEYATLRSAERPYLVVGKGRDVELAADPAAVRRLVLALVEKSVSVIIDLSEHDTDEQHTIVAAVCDALVSLPENHPGNAAVVLEELQEYAPEGGGKGSALPSVRRLAKRGLKRGFFIIGASQRVSDVSKGVITMLKTKMIGGTDHKDAPRALEELGLPARDRSMVTDLAQGEFWVKGPAFDRHAQHVRVPRSVTAPPKRKRGDPPAPAAEAPAEIAALAKALAAAAATESVSASSTSSDVRKGDILPFSYSNNELQRARDEARFDEAQRHERYRRVLHQAASAARARVVEVQRDLDEVLEGFDAVMAGIDEEWMKPVPPDPANVPEKRAIVPPSRISDIRQSSAKTAAPRPPVIADANLSPLQQRILNGVAELESIGIAHPHRDQVAVFINYGTLSSGTGGKAMGALIERQLLAIPRAGAVELTVEGRKRAQRQARPPRLAELHQRILAKLTPLERRILEHLIADRRVHRRDELSVALKYGTLSSGTGGKAAGKLVALNFAVIPEPGALQVGPLLFPKGLK